MNSEEGAVSLGARGVIVVGVGVPTLSENLGRFVLLRGKAHSEVVVVRGAPEWTMTVVDYLAVLL